MEAALVLSHVCAAWRQLIISNPILWTKLVIPLPGDERDDDKINTYLSRTGEIVLSNITAIESPTESQEISPGITAFTVDLQSVTERFRTRVLPYLNRCRQLAWVARSKAFTPSIFSSLLTLPASLPELERLSLQFVRSQMPWARPFPHMHFRSSILSPFGTRT
jgi:hypothetical protein